MGGIGEDAKTSLSLRIKKKYSAPPPFSSVLYTKGRFYFAPIGSASKLRSAPDEKNPGHASVREWSLLEFEEHMTFSICS